MPFKSLDSKTAVRELIVMLIAMIATELMS